MSNIFNSIVSITKVSFFGFIIMLAIPLSANADYWRGGVSEETPPKTCDVGDLAIRVFCSGRFCDNTWLKCKETNLTNLSNRVWQSFVSEEGNNVRDCGNGYITGLAAKGRYGDNISIECSYFRGRSPRNCVWTTSVSEEQGQLAFPNGKFAKAIQCRGRYCDNKRFLVCS